MSLNMYLGETDTQKNSMNAMCVDLILAMEQVQSSIRSFTWNVSLRGKTYDSAKTYMNRAYLPLTQGVIYLCEELIRQNDKYPDDFRSGVSSMDVVEGEVQAQIDEIDRMINRLEQLNEFLPVFGIKVFIYERVKRTLLQKLSDLYAFNSTSSSNYTTAMEFAASVMEGLSQIQGGKGFNEASGTFSTDGMDMSWVTDLNETHYTRRAKEEFGDYIGKDSEKLDKVIEILKYEDANPDDAEKVTEFLSPLEEQDVVEIKYLMYTAEEPYRSLAIRYLNQVELVPEEINPDKKSQSSYFSPSKNRITYLYERDRDNGRGAYFTIFHEIGHALDYNYGDDDRGRGFFGSYRYFTDYYESDNQTLTDTMHVDFEETMRNALERELNKSAYRHLSAIEKTIMTNNIMMNLLKQNGLFPNMSEEERELQMTLEDQFAVELTGPNHSLTSDVFGGITNFTIEGNYGHDSDYWFNFLGIRKRDPNREGFAEYFARLMTKDSEGENPGIDSVGEFMPDSIEQMDEIIDSMSKDGK